MDKLKIAKKEAPAKKLPKRLIIPNNQSKVNQYDPVGTGRIFGDYAL